MVLVRALVEMLSSQGIAAMRTPTDQGHVVRELTHLYPLEQRQIDDEVIVPDRLLDDAWLTELNALPSVVECECPHHLVDIVRTSLSLRRTARTVVRNAEDAAFMPGFMQRGAARATFEHAIIDVAEYEGITFRQVWPGPEIETCLVACQ